MPPDDAQRNAPSAPPEGPPKKKRPRGSDKCQRMKQFMVRCTPVEFNDIASNANAAGMRGGAYLRGLGLKGNPGERSRYIPPVESELLKTLRGDLGRLNNNVNQIAHQLNMGGYVAPSDLRQVLLDYPGLRNAIFQALGKEPSPDALDWDLFISLVKDAAAANPASATITLPAPLLLRIITSPAAGAAVPVPIPKPPKKPK
jgi:hypothetical protein